MGKIYPCVGPVVSGSEPLWDGGALAGAVMGSLRLRSEWCHEMTASAARSCMYDRLARRLAARSQSQSTADCYLRWARSSLVPHAIRAIPFGFVTVLECVSVDPSA
jgi:hypothetical protein